MRGREEASTTCSGFEKRAKARAMAAKRRERRMWRSFMVEGIGMVGLGGLGVVKSGADDG